MIMPDRPGKNVTRVSLFRKFCLRLATPSGIKHLILACHGMGELLFSAVGGDLEK
jgi:hypothetical protein